MSMKGGWTGIAGMICALAAVVLIAWMCFESWGGVSPF
jgi:hypothetical protein